jgi:hypothetical protein
MIKKVRLEIVSLLVCCLCCLHGAYAKSYKAIESVQVMAEQDADAKLLGTLKKGTVIDVTPIDDHWGKVTFKGKTGYVTNEYFDDVPNSEMDESTGVGPATTEKRELSEHDKKLLAFVIGFIVLLIVIKRVLHYRSSMSDRRKAADFEEEKKYQPKFWYQCKHCWVTVRRESAPISQGCFNAPDHDWFELAEYGKTRYLCKKCSTLLNVRAEPAIAPCKGGEMHVWKKLQP